MKLKKLFGGLLLAASVITLAACGSDSSDKDSSSGEKEAQGVTKDKILVGNSAATSGAYAPVGAPFNAGIEGYFKMINDEGGVDGRKIEFEHVDDEFDPSKGKAALQTLVEDKKVFAIVGDFGTPVIAATLPDIKNYGIPAVYFASGIGELYNDKAEGSDAVVFPVQPIYVTEGEMMVARGVGDFKAKKIGIIYTTDDAGKDMLEGAEKEAKELGVDFYSEQVAAGATDVTAAVTALLKNKVDFIIGASIQNTFPTIVKALAAQGNTADVITTYVNVDGSIADQIYDDVKGKFEVYGNGWVDLTSEKSKKNLELMNKWIKADYQNNVYAMTGWMAADMFTQGLERLKGEPITWDGYIKAMESKPIDNPFGGEIDYANGSRKGTQEMNLSKITDKSTWTEVEPLKSSKDILKK